MRILVAAILIFVVCAPLMAEDAATPSAMAADSMLVSPSPMMVPVMTNTNTVAAMTSGQNVTVLVPMSVDRDTMSKLIANNSIAMMMVPVGVPVTMAQGTMSGAGPAGMMSPTQLMAGK